MVRIVINLLDTKLESPEAYLFKIGRNMLSGFKVKDIFIKTRF